MSANKECEHHVCPDFKCGKNKCGGTVVTMGSAKSKSEAVKDAKDLAENIALREINTCRAKKCPNDCPEQVFEPDKPEKSIKGPYASNAQWSSGIGNNKTYYVVAYCYWDLTVTCSPKKEKKEEKKKAVIKKKIFKKKMSRRMR